jgi:hypothetical protein
MFIKYSPKDPHVKIVPVVISATGCEAVPLANESVILRPGTNELTEERWKAIQPHVRDEISKKIIVPFSVEVKKDGGAARAKTLKDVPVSVARKIIESCQNADDLKKWVRQELPDEIMLLVLKRLRKFRIDPDEFADDLSGGEDTLDADITPEDGGEENPAGEESGEADTATPKSKGGGNRSGKKPRGENKDSGEGGEPDDDEDDDDEIPDFDGSRSRE